MKLAKHPRRAAPGFTLLEMLFVTLIIGILSVLLLPVIAKSQARAKRAQCASQLRQMGIAFHDFSHDHGDKFPFQVETNQGGTLEYARAGFAMSGEFFFAYRHFQVLSNALVTPRMLRCPTDARDRAESFETLRNDHLSYFAGVSAEYSQPLTILGGDRNIMGDALAGGSIVRVSARATPVWTGEMHEFKGNLLFADGHVEGVNNTGLSDAIHMTGKPPGYFLPPVIGPPGGGGGEGSGPPLLATLEQFLNSGSGGASVSSSSSSSSDSSGGSSALTSVNRERKTALSSAPSALPGTALEQGAIRSAGFPSVGMRSSAERPSAMAPVSTNAPPALKTTAQLARTNPSSQTPAVRESAGTESAFVTFFTKPERYRVPWLLLLLLAVILASALGRHLQRRRAWRRIVQRHSAVPG